MILQSALRSVDSDPADAYLQSSSPLSRLSRKSLAGNLASARSTRTGLRRSTRLSGSPDGNANELASGAPVAGSEEGTIAEEPGPDVAQDDSIPEVAETVVEEPIEIDSPEVDEAREIDDREAARRLGRKRIRRSIPAASPELASEDVAEEPIAKRPRQEAPLKKKKKSPAKQRQPKGPRAQQSKSESKRKPKGDQDAAGPPVGIAVQRFTRIRRRGDDSDGEDVLNSMVPHSNRDGVNAIDVLAQMCKEISGVTLNKMKESFREAQDAPTKKELRVKISALGAFQEELRTRLLEHVRRPYFPPGS